MSHDHDAAEGGVSKHPPESALAAYLDGELADEERPHVEAHLEQCAECRRAVADVVEVLDAVERAGATKNPGPVRRRRSLALVGLGLALAASIASVIVLRRPLTNTADIEARTRDATPSTQDERTSQLGAVTPVDGSSGVGAHPVFTWHSADASRYSFRLLAEDGVPVWSRETTDTTLTLPADVRLQPGRSYFWRVDALAAGIVASTRAQRFTVSP